MKYVTIYYKYVYTAKGEISVGFKLGFIGAGNMAGAIISSVLNNGTYSAEDIFICEKNEIKRGEYAQKGFVVVADETELVKRSNFVFLAVKPADLRGVLEKIAPFVTINNVIVSIAAGASIRFIKSLIGPDSKVVRVMPNMPLTVGKGATAIAYEMPITYREFLFVKKIFEASGIVETLEDSQMNEITSVSGSGPAYVYALILAMINGAVAQGIDRGVAEQLVIQTVSGAVSALEKTGEDAEFALKKVCSPNGTTLKAIEVFEKEGFNQTVADAMLACTKRAAEMGKEL